jgi:hypothetical protein
MKIQVESDACSVILSPEFEDEFVCTGCECYFCGMNRIDSQIP